MANRERKQDQKNITIPISMAGAKYNTMDPKAMEEQRQLAENGSCLYCSKGSHLAMWDDQKVFISGVIDRIKKINDNN